jgi:hypothetical protein
VKPLANGVTIDTGALVALGDEALCVVVGVGVGVAVDAGVGVDVGTGCGVVR